MVSTNTNTQSKQKEPKKDRRRRRRQESLQQAKSQYDGITFLRRESTGRPGTPHRFFSSSYTVKNEIDNIEAGTSGNDIEPKSEPPQEKKISEGSPSEPLVMPPILKPRELNVCIPHHQVIHQHKNGLVIVTAGSAIQNFLTTRTKNLEGNSTTPNVDADVDSSMTTNSCKTITPDSCNVKIIDVTFPPQISDFQTVGAKRKKAKKMKSGVGCGKNGDGYVRPKDTIAVVTFDDGSTIDLKCCVAGTLLEVNERLVGNARTSARKNDLDESKHEDERKGESGHVHKKVKSEVKDDANIDFHKGHLDASGRNDQMEVGIKQQEMNNTEHTQSKEQSGKLLLNDPLLEGFLAVIMPSGFPVK